MKTKMYLVLAIFALLASIPSNAIFAQSEADIKLPAANKTGGKPLMQALNERSSAREFSDKELTLQELSDLLWAADGINRPELGKRTAPTAMNWQDLDIYVVLRSGIYLYAPKEHTLILKKAGNFMKTTGKQPFVENAALNLIFVSDFNKMKTDNIEDKQVYAGIHAGCIIQNVYLYCASVGLNTVTRRFIPFEDLKKAMGLADNEHIIMSQTVGYKPVKK